MGADVDALTFGKVLENVNGKLIEKIVDVTGSTGYPNTGATMGYTFPVALSTRYGQLGIATLVGVETVATNTTAKGWSARWDSQAGKLHFFAAGSEAGDGGDLSGYTLRLKLTGTR